MTEVLKNFTFDQFGTYRPVQIIIHVFRVLNLSKGQKSIYIAWNEVYKELSGKLVNFIIQYLIHSNIGILSALFTLFFNEL